MLHVQLVQKEKQGQKVANSCCACLQAHSSNLINLQLHVHCVPCVKVCAYGYACGVHVECMYHALECCVLPISAIR